jgi:hypothetical protein
MKLSSRSTLNLYLVFSKHFPDKRRIEKELQMCFHCLDSLSMMMMLTMLCFLVLVLIRMVMLFHLSLYYRSFVVDSSFVDSYSRMKSSFFLLILHEVPYFPVQRLHNDVMTITRGELNSLYFRADFS